MARRGYSPEQAAVLTAKVVRAVASGECYEPRFCWYEFIKECRKEMTMDQFKKEQCA